MSTRARCTATGAPRARMPACATGRAGVSTGTGRCTSGARTGVSA